MAVCDKWVALKIVEFVSNLTYCNTIGDASVFDLVTWYLLDAYYVHGIVSGCRIKFVVQVCLFI